MSAITARHPAPPSQDPTPSPFEAKPTAAKIGAQGILLFAGFGMGQLLSFARNAILGHTLSPRDFGIAASITLLLQLLEMLSDVGHDRLIVQAADGDRDDFVATTHAILLARGMTLALLLYVISPYAAAFFAVPEAQGAFALIALVPLIKGLMHMDCRRAQRRLDNRPQLLVEVAPQALALAATLPVLKLYPGFEAVVVLSLIQASSSVVVARLLARTPYRLAFCEDVVKRLLRFGWPIMLSALPLIAVYQGDRAIVGHLAGIEALAAYSAAFMITMVPGLVAARAGHALMLPVFASVLRQKDQLQRSFATMAEATTILASVYLGVFIIAGGSLLTLAFGPSYQGLNTVVTWLAGMWAMRMLQAVPGMALMAAGDTRPFLIAGLIRASVLPFVFYCAAHGASLSEIAAIGCVGETLSLLYVTLRLERLESGLSLILFSRSAFLVPTAIAALLTAQTLGSNPVWVLICAAAMGMALMAAGSAVMPSIRALVRRAMAAQSLIAEI
ncbi:MAG: oligosaccharide flippase family protein [Hyphomicrobiaceae bacterium]